MAKQTKKKAASSQKKEPVKQEINFIDGYLLQQEDGLIPLAQSFSTSEALAEKSFKSESELCTLFLKNSQLLFGDKRIVIQVKNQNVFGEDLFPPLLMLDLNVPDKPQFFILDMYVGSQDFYVDVFPRVSKLFLFFKKDECKGRLLEYLAKDKVLCKRIAASVAKEALDVLKAGLQRLGGIYFISEQQIEELEKMKEVYTDHWPKVKQVTLKKLSGRKNSYVSFLPGLNDISWEAKKRSKENKAPTSEAEHLENCSAGVKDVYNMLKSSILEANPNLTLNVQRYYIAFRKQKNAVIFLITKKRLSIVVMHPESKTKRVIKYHEIKSLTPTVQMFYGAACCMVKVESTEHIDEVINLLKIVVS